MRSLVVALACCALLPGCLRAGYAPAADAASDRASRERPPTEGVGADHTTLCTPGARRCSGGARYTCSADGAREARQLCALGCTPDLCLQPLPSNGVTAPATETLVDWVAPAGTSSIDLDAGVVPGSPSVTTVGQGAGAPELAVLSYRSLTIPLDAELRVTGRRALVLLAERIVIAGVLSVRAVGATPGPAGGRGGCAKDEPGLGTGGGKAGLLGSGVADGGGGGGGHGSVGGAGGQGALGGAGGAAYGAATLVPLRGGSGGGAGSPGKAATAACGGGGGGAVQLVALGELVVSGAIHAGGGGGGAGAPNADNGGGGGGGTPKFLALGTAGEDSVGAKPALGGVGSGDEGWGGAGSVLAGSGGAAPAGADNGGGGGGGAGRIRIHAQALSVTGPLNGLSSTGSLASTAAP